MKRNYAIVTGASRGIGRYAALALARSGCSILAAARKDLQGLKSLQKEITETYGQECLLFLGDAGSEKSILSLFQQLPTDASLKVLVNNAGISHIGLLQDMSFDQ